MSKLWPSFDEVVNAQKLKSEQKNIKPGNNVLWPSFDEVVAPPPKILNDKGFDITGHVMNPQNPNNIIAESQKQDEENVPWIYKHLPGTAALGDEILNDPFSLHENKNPIKAAWGSIKGSFSTEIQNIKDLVSPPTKKVTAGEAASDATSKGIKAFITGPAGILFSPISALFEAGNNIPVVGTATRLVTMPFSIAGEGGSGVAGKLIDEMPISDAAKEKLKPGVQEMFALAAQLALGKISEIGSAKVDALVKEYGVNDAGTIISKSVEMSKEYPKLDQKQLDDMGFKTKPVPDTKLTTDKVIPKTKSVLKDVVSEEVIKPRDEVTLYHGSRIKDLTELNNLNKVKYPDGITGELKTSYTRGVSMTDNPKTAEFFAKDRVKALGGEKAIYEKKFNKNHFLDLTNQKELAKIMDKISNKAKYSKGYFTDQLKKYTKGSIVKGSGKKPILGDDFQYLVRDKKSFENLTKYLDKNKKIGVKFVEDANKPFGSYLLKDKVSLSKPEVKAEPLPKKQSGVSSSIEAKAIEEGMLKDGFRDVAQYDPITIKDQAAKVAKLMKDDMESVRQMVRGEKPVPGDVRAAALIKAVEDLAMSKGDSTMMRELAKSKLVSETSLHAQELRLLAERNPESAVVQMREIIKAREKAVERRTGKTVDKAQKAEIKKIKDEVAKTAPKEKDWSSFIESIKCK